MKAKKISLIFVLLTVACFPAQSAVLVAWDVNGLSAASLSETDNYSFAAMTIASNIETTALTLGPKLIPSDTAGQYGFKVPAGQEQPTKEDAMNAGHFFEFAVQALPGYLLDLTNLEMKGQSSGTGADEVALLASTDNFTTNSMLGSLSGISDKTGGFDTDGSGFGSIDLSSYRGVEQVTFRLYGWDTTGDQGITYIRDLTGDDLVIEGSVTAVPEVTSALTLTGLLVFSAFTRRRRPGV